MLSNYVYGDLRKECCVRGYHVYNYKDTWEVVIGEELECVSEQSNTIDQYAVAVSKDDTIVGHLPKTSAHIYSLFLKALGHDVRPDCY